MEDTARKLKDKITPVSAKTALPTVKRKLATCALETRFGMKNELHKINILVFA